MSIVIKSYAILIKFYNCNIEMGLKEKGNCSVFRSDLFPPLLSSVFHGRICFEEMLGDHI